MARLVKKRTKKTGLPPGTLIHIGERKTEKVTITVIDYDASSLREFEVNDIAECYPLKDKPTVTWINIEGLHHVETIQKLGDHYGLHPLVLEDILNTDQRPKAEDYGDYLYIVLRMFHSNSGVTATAEQVSIILGTNFVISFQEGAQGDVFNNIRERIRNSKGRIRNMGADYLAYSLTDSIVDNYFVILEKLGEEIEFLEEAVVKNPAPETLHRMQHLKRELIFLRKSVWPLREVISNLERGESPLIQGSTKIYLRDVYDHTIQAIDTLETFRDMATGMLDIYLSSVSNRLNAVMKVLTIITTIFMPLTFIAGIYGMNFEYMPELKWKWGYPLVLLVMLSLGASMVFYFKRKKWL